MVRYPHSVTVTVSGESVKDENTGDYSVGSPTPHVSMCAVMGNSRGRKIGTDDGQQIEYSQSILMPLQSWIAPFGAAVSLVFSGGEVMQGTVKLMRNHQTYSQIWV